MELIEWSIIKVESGYQQYKANNGSEYFTHEIGHPLIHIFVYHCIQIKYMARLNLIKPFGIQLSIHWTFIFIIAWILFLGIRQGLSNLQLMYSVLFVLTIFVCVVLHELGHALAARQYGIGTSSIVLLPIGGVANLEKIPEKPEQELWVAIAGPLVNVAIAIILGGILWVTGNFQINMEITAIQADNFFFMLMVVNILLVVFNMIPAFPMDGGRILRAFLAFYLSRKKATLIATRIGQLFAVVFLFLGFTTNPFLIIIAIFIFIAAQSEFNAVSSQHLIGSYSVGDAMLTRYKALSPSDTLQDAVNALLTGTDERFLVLDEQGRLSGIITKGDIIRNLASSGPHVNIRQVMTTEIFTLPMDAPLMEGFHAMMHRGFSIIPVLQNGTLAGILERNNVMEFMGITQAMTQYKDSTTRR